MAARLELGAETFGDVNVEAETDGARHGRVLRDVVEEGVIADQAGLDFFGVGEHHRPDYAVSAPEIVLSAIAARTSTIRLGSAVTVLSSDDPVRVFQRFATLDGISDGRAEMILGRGSFIESFPLFGYDLQDYEVLFDEKLALMAKLLTEEPVTWSGQTRASLSAQEVYPKTERGLRAWVGVGGSPESVVRAARRELPLMLAIIGGDPLAFAPFTQLYREQLGAFGHAQQPIAAHLHGFVADTDEEAKELLWPHYFAQMSKMGRERGWRGYGRGQFEAATSERGNLLVGSPETVAQKIVHIATHLGLSRLDLKMSNGTLAHSHIARSIELLGTEVAPLVHDMMAD
ncbi:LLM class flavin-dependent oxidoreductase [Zhihengliuella flava]|uniref:LLM family oxidoreductase n=1 Tax=Zhihengliuella flava TaxID=1285193 RepID=A0A931DA98_9MICC|nr:LLM class flavin-dependent oxidoreductase [Zhihengliuella flava]MBG6085224.1 putative LLM family oxidoreductase [Zhihengliuella flava]